MDFPLSWRRLWLHWRVEPCQLLDATGWHHGRMVLLVKER
jgi:hypothetical protein